jgi:outer membrane protein assembly factor BamA
VETGSLSLEVKAGRITGTAPLFDRFSIGNVDALRGWNKFEIAARGTTRIVHGSLEYSAFVERCKCVRGYLLYDAGAGWNDGESIRVRHSAGVGIGVLKGFMEVSFPIMRLTNPNDKNSAEMFGAPTFTLGLRHNISEILRW